MRADVNRTEYDGVKVLVDGVKQQSTKGTFVASLDQVNAVVTEQEADAEVQQQVHTDALNDLSSSDSSSGPDSNRSNSSSSSIS